MTTEYYTPGSNANVITIRQEKNYNPDHHGNGDIQDISVTAHEAYKALRNYRSLVSALKHAKEMIDKALPKFNWAASALDSSAITLLNEAPISVAQALKDLDSD